MKQLFFIAAMLVFAGLSQAQDYQLNPSKSSLSWKGYGEGGGFVQEGTIDPQEGQLRLKEGGIVSTQVVVNMPSISSGDKDLTKHLKNEDFFDIKKFPEATLKLISYSEGKAKADLTIKGETHPVEIMLDYKQEGNTVTVTGSLAIDRTIYGIKYNSSSFFQDLGSYAIKNNFDLAFELTFELVKE